jgi:hypothetical protein
MPPGTMVHPGAVANGNWQDGRPLPEGFRYTSDSNSLWLTAGELCEIRETQRPPVFPLTL